MPLLNFKKQFAPKVESGEKRTSFRATRKRPFKPGDKLYLYTGLRTRQSRKLGDGTCIEALDCKINGFKHPATGIYIAGRRLPLAEAEQIAKADGFDSLLKFFAFFEETHGIEFKGQYIRW